MSYDITNTNYMALPGLIPGTVMVAYMSPDHIINIVGEVLGITKIDMFCKNRKRDKVEARQIAMYLIRKHTKFSLAEIGKIFGGRDHTTTIHSIETVNNLCFSDDNYRSKLLYIENKL